MSLDWPLSRILRIVRGFLQSVDVPHEKAKGLQARQVQSIQQLVSIMLLVGLLNTAIVMTLLNSIGAISISFIWGYSLILINGLSFLHYLRNRKYQQRSDYPERKIAALRKSAAVHGILWGILPLLVAMGSTDAQFMMISTVTAGMLFGGTFLLSRVPSAALSFLGPVAVGIVAAAFLRSGLANHLLGILALVYVFVLTYAVRWAHRQFVQQYLSQASLSEQSQVIRLLLRDFGESSADWLWQTDKDFRLQPMPCSQPAESEWHNYLVSGRSLFSLIDGGEGHRALKSAMQSGQAFKDIELALRGRSRDNVWISFTGKPIYEDGIFRGYRGVARDVTLTRLTGQRLEKMTHFDELTGLPNRAHLLTHLDAMVANPPREGMERALLLLDLDTFKVVNDTLGHQAADQLLRQVTNRLTESSLSSDFVARIASDGFAMVIDRSVKGGVKTFLNSLSRYLSEPYSVWDATIVCTASIGIRKIDDTVWDVRTVLKQADLAMHEARRRGRGGWAMFSLSLEQEADTKLRIESDLRDALARRELRLVYQPQVDAQSRKLVGFEALLRWEHSARGVIPPSEFIGIAEENGTIVSIGEWIIRTAIADAARMPASVKVAINISPLQINSPQLVSTLINSAAANGVDPKRIDLEITESALMSDTGMALDRLRQLRDFGFTISLDDFGTGYSSLTYLKMFPFDKIKIDQNFVRGLDSESESRAITQAVLTLARLMGLRTVAEGVETPFQAEFLRNLGCDDLQGFLISKPLGLASHAAIISDANPGFDPGLLSDNNPLDIAIADSPQNDAQRKLAVHAR